MNVQAKKEYDAIVIGSGATGGLAAKMLCEGGLKVLVVESGGDEDPNARGESGQLATFKGPESAVQRRCVAFNHKTSPYFINDVDNPYTTPERTPFSWIRCSVVGGKTMVWAGQSYRMSNLDFRAPRFDGFGEEWPLSYEELAPYYGKVERELGVTGTEERIEHLPDGEFYPLEPQDGNAAYLRTAFAKRGHAVIPARLSILRDPHGTNTYCRHCGRTNQGCLIHTTSTATLAAAARTSNLTLCTNTIARQLVTARDGRAVGVHAVDKQTRREFEITGKMFFVCASALESTRILLNSTSPAHPHGFGNSSGVLGHYLMDHVSGPAAIAYFSDRDPTAAAKPTRPTQLMYMPRSQNLTSRNPRGFLRGYGHQITLVRAQQYMSDAGPGCAAVAPTTAPSTLAKVAAGQVLVRIHPFGEMLPRFENRVEIDKTGKVDAWGIPVLAIHCQHGENEKEMVKDMICTLPELVDACGAKLVSLHKRAQEPGLCVHEAGTCRMGADPGNSVLNKYGQCHDVPNVFVTDGSSFPSQGTQNPTLTMMALTMRAAELALDLAKRGELR
jgi:choline dehydrogenase-like flavoprotein